MKTILRLVRFTKPYWKLSLISLLLLTAVVATDLAIPRLIQVIVDQGIAQKNMAVVIHTSLLMVGITILALFLATGNSIFSVMAGAGFGRDLRRALFEKIQTLSFGNLDNLRTGRLIVRLTSDVTQLQRLFQISLRIGTRAPLLMIGSVVLLIRTSPLLALYVSPILVLTALAIVLFITRLRPMFMSVQVKLDNLNNVLQENIAGVRVVKAFVRSVFENKRFADVNQDLTERTIMVMEYLAFLMPALTGFINLGIVMVIWIGGKQAIHGSLTVGEIIAFTNYLLTTMMPLMILAMIASSLAGAGASAERVMEIFDSVPMVQDNPEAVLYPSNGQGRVVFERVCFSYDGNCHEPVLQSIDLTAEPGETVAVLGSTGSGKSSLIKLIPRFYDSVSGRVLIDGIDVRDIQKDSLLARIGVVMQESILFTGSVRDNIRYGRPQANDEEVLAAAKVAQAHDFIMEMPDGYDTMISQRGANLSGGQKQRIAIARALLLKPKILILDDCTSSVDVETEAKIQLALSHLMKGRTTFIVAQRISTVLNADKIVVLDHGQVAAQGSHHELLTSSPIYQEIYESQLGNGVANHA
jgi:ATP-binding cassette subfamily B multidrug efflux pump